MLSRYRQQSSRIPFAFLLLLFLVFISGPLSSAALAQSYVFGTGSFAVAGVGPRGLAAADFNDDGKIDLAVANDNGTSLSPGEVSVLLGNPDGSFAPKRDYTSGACVPTASPLETLMETGSRTWLWALCPRRRLWCSWVRATALSARRRASS